MRYFLTQLLEMYVRFCSVSGQKCTLYYFTRQEEFLSEKHMSLGHHDLNIAVRHWC